MGVPVLNEVDPQNPQLESEIDLMSKYNMEVWFSLIQKCVEMLELY